MERLLKHASTLEGAMGKTFDINNLSDVYEAIHLVQEELGITGTTALEAEKTLSGSFNSMKAAAQDFMGNLVIGGDISASMSNLVSSASTFLFGNLIPAIVNVGKALPAALWSGLTTALPAIWKNLQSLTGQLTSFLNEQVPKLAEQIPVVMDSIVNKIKTGFPKLLQSGGEMITNLVTGLLGAIPSLITAAGDIISRIPEIVANNAPTLIAKGKELITNLITGIASKLPAIVKSMGTLAGKLIAALIKYAPKMLAAGVKLIGELIKGLIKLLPKLPSYGIKLIKAFVRGIKSIKLPKLSISWSTSSKGEGKNKISIPVPKITWNKYGGIYDGASIIGVGEAGKEAVVPLSGNQMKPFAKAISDNLGGGGNTYNFGNITIDASSLQDIATVEDFALMLKRAKAFA